jgi:hypothetical protein
MTATATASPRQLAKRLAPLQKSELESLTRDETEHLKAICLSYYAGLKRRDPMTAARIDVNEIINESWVRVVTTLQNRQAEGKPINLRRNWIAKAASNTARQAFAKALNMKLEAAEDGVRLRVRETTFTDLSAKLW